MVCSNKNIILPRQISLEASTVCQLKCHSCPTASDETGKGLGVGYLKFSDFKDIVDKNCFISNIQLSNWGEIFLNNELIKIVKYAYKHNVVLSALNGVNLNHVNEDVLEALVKYRFRAITCSIDGANQDTYAVYRVGGNFQQVIENIETINKFKTQYNSPYPILHWQFIAFGHNEHEIGKARRMAVDLNMEFRVKLSWEDLYGKSFSPIKDAELIRKETGLGVASRGEFREKYGKEYILRDCCLKLWKRPQINYDGRILGCGINYWGDYGNAFKDRLKECLNNEKINYARDMLMGKRESKKDIPCTQCQSYKRMRESKTWITNEEVEGSYNKKGVFILLEDRVLGYKLIHQLARRYALMKGRLRNHFFSTRETIRAKSSLRLTSGIYPLEIPLLPDLQVGWKPYPIFRGSTKCLRDLSCHVSVLIQDRCPHPPHKHKEEELLLLLSGEIDLILSNGQLPNKNLRTRLKAGQFVYYPADFGHTLQTVSETPANYLMFKWSAKSRKNDSALTFGQFDMLDPVKDSEVGDGFRTRLVFEGQTVYLQKLHCHSSTLTPGAGYDPHIDPYDVAIILLEGEVETLGERVGRPSVIFYAAGEPHGMRNPNDTIAKYVVFAFHGRK
jgi:MoaA/NifB/PqqE/SkfB family radical SAM enzyme/quercetin dioxygenase-like cupin family protein